MSGVSWNIFTMFLGITLCFGESVGRVKIQGTRTEMTEMALKMIARLTIIFGFYENPTTEQNAMKRKKLPLITSIKELLVNGLETWYIFLCHASFWRARAVGELKYKGGDALFAICDVYNKRQTSLLEHKYQYVRNLSFKCYFYSTEWRWILKLLFACNITVATLVSQNNETVAMLVFPTNPVVVELFSYANAFFFFQYIA